MNKLTYCSYDGFMEMDNLRNNYDSVLELDCKDITTEDKFWFYFGFVNDTLRMYKNDDIRMYNFNCITDTIVEVITTCNTYTLLTVHLL